LMNKMQRDFSNNLSTKKTANKKELSVEVPQLNLFGA